jgi:hypothetical protein
MRRAMRLQEAVARRELAKGAKANLNKVTEASMAAASLAKEIAAIEDRRGIRSSGPVVNKFEIELVMGDPLQTKLREENTELHGRVAALESMLVNSDAATPVSEIAPSHSPSSIGTTQTQSNAAPKGLCRQRSGYSSGRAIPEKRQQPAKTYG